MNRKRLLALLLVFSTGIVVTTISFAAWEVRHIDNNSGNVEDGLYEVIYHYDQTSQKVSSLELTSGFDLLEFDPSVEDLANERYAFLGWKIGSSSEMTSKTNAKVFTNQISHTPKDLLSEYDNVPADNIIHLWECWSNQIPSDKVLLTITYNTNQLHYQLVNAISKYYLFNITIPGYEAESFKYNDIDYSLNNYIDLATYGGKKVSLIAN